MRNQIITVSDLVTEIGGARAAAEFLGTTQQNLGHWIRTGKIPPAHYKRHQKKLSAKRIPVADSLWDFAEAAE